MMHWKRVVGCLGLWFVLVACKSNERQHQAHKQPLKFKGDSCAACGMIVREQSSPRGQVVHRNGKHFYFCSLSDMLSYLETPSPHGAVISVFVEVMDPKAKPEAFRTKQEPWLPASQVTFVLGVAKPRVMGVPILAYRNQIDAQRWAKRSKGQVFQWATLKPAWRKLRNK